MIPVIWYRGLRGNWDHGLLLSIFDKYPDIFPQYNDAVPPKGINKAIVIITGCPTEDESKALFAYLSTMNDKTIVILTSEEDGFFQWKKYIPPQLQIWTSYFTESKREIKERLLLGAPHRIKEYKINTHLPKKYLFSFVGQLQNPFRQQMYDVAKTIPDGFLRVVQYFGGNGHNATEYQEYLDIMCQSKYVLCPSGSMSADSFRLYEAIECGAIPITDKRSPRDSENFNYWDSVYPGNKIIKVKEWDFIKNINKHSVFPSPYDNNGWWFKYKQELEQKLLNYAKNI